MSGKGSGLKTAAAAIGLISAVVGLIGAIKRVTCPCCGTSLPFRGDTEVLGTRYCSNCGHNH